MNIFKSPAALDARFPKSSPSDIEISPKGQSNSGKTGKSVRLRERTPVVDLDEPTKNKFFRFYDGEQLYHRPETTTPPDSRELFNDDAAVNWDIGCGRGERLVEMAAENPDKLYVGVDIHYRSLALGVRAAANAQLDNVRFIRANASLLAPQIPSETADSVSILFPAPLPNHKDGFNGMPTLGLTHHIHRILEGDGAPFEFASDSEPYFNYQMRQIGSTGLFSCSVEELASTVSSASHPTRYQKIWESKGIPTHSAIVRKVS